MRRYGDVEEGGGGGGGYREKGQGREKGGLGEWDDL